MSHIDSQLGDIGFESRPKWKFSNRIFPVANVHLEFNRDMKRLEEILFLELKSKKETS